jgi:hypothetical protein
MTPHPEPIAQNWRSAREYRGHLPPMQEVVFREGRICGEAGEVPRLRRRDRSSRGFAALAYFSPLVVGTILVFFMVKSLFFAPALNVRLVARLAEVAEEVEKAIGLKPLPEPSLEQDAP